MTDVLQPYRQLCRTPSDAIRWACILEATAPKAGNVFPGQSFRDLCYRDFVDAAEISAKAFDSAPQRFSQAVLEAVRRIATQVGTNVNLGILLLLGPLVQVDRAGGLSRADADLIRAVTDTLQSLDRFDAECLYQAINAAHPGGMGQVDEMDLAEAPPPNFLDAMSAAADRDRIAANYATGFADLITRVVPILDQAISEAQDVLLGTSVAHLRLLADREDSLIERKYGREVASNVRRQADFDHHDLDARLRFDDFLRNGHTKPLNPGTTADLIAAGLYCLLRRRFPTSTRISDEPTDLSR